MFQAIQGHWLTACLGVLMDLKIPEILTAQQQPVEFRQVTLVSVTWYPTAAFRATRIRMLFFQASLLCTSIMPGIPLSYLRRVCRD